VRRPAQPEPDDEEFEPKDDDEEEERPARGLRGVAGKAKPKFRGGAKEAPKKPPLRTGWGGAHRTKEMGGDFADELKLDDEHVLIKFGFTSRTQIAAWIAAQHAQSSYRPHRPPHGRTPP